MFFDIKIYNQNSASIKDLSGDINFSNYKWSQLFEFCNRLFDTAYFNGYRTNYLDVDFLNTIEFISKEILCAEMEYKELIIKIKPSSLELNRQLFNKLWNYYEFPTIVYLGDVSDESQLVKAYRNNLFHEDVIDLIENVLIISMLPAELDVVWMKTNIDINILISLLR